MHEFTDLIERCTSFTLSVLNRANDEIVEALQDSAETTLIKNLQMIQLQKAIMAVGMFSIFDSILQENLGGNGFVEASKVLKDHGEHAVDERFSDFQKAINVLKHGRGRSYDELVKKASELPFKVKLPDEAFFFEGDVSEVSTLIQVDDQFILDCAAAIQTVSSAIRKVKPEFLD